MTRYRRALLEGGTFFFTVTLADRSSNLLVRHIDLMRRAYRYAQGRRPFETIAICVLPDSSSRNLAATGRGCRLPVAGAFIKASFSRSAPAKTSRSASKIARREKGFGLVATGSTSSGTETTWS